MQLLGPRRRDQHQEEYDRKHDAEDDLAGRLVLAARIIISPAALVGHGREDALFDFGTYRRSAIFQVVRRRPIITIPALGVAPPCITNPPLFSLFLQFLLALLVELYFIHPVGVGVPPVVALREGDLVVLIWDRIIIILLALCKGREEDEVRSSEDHGGGLPARRVAVRRAPSSKVGSTGLWGQPRRGDRAHSERLPRQCEHRCDSSGRSVLGAARTKRRATRQVPAVFGNRRRRGAHHCKAEASPGVLREE